MPVRWCAGCATVASGIPGRSKRHDRRLGNSCDSCAPGPAGTPANVPNRCTVYSAAVTRMWLGGMAGPTRLHFSGATALCPQ